MEDSDTEFRAILVKMTDFISAVQLTKLRFIFSDKIKRGDHIGTTIDGVIDLFRQLLERGIIDRQNLVELINALDDVGCRAAVQLLRNYQSTMMGRQTLIKDISIDNELDKYLTHEYPPDLDDRSSIPQQDFLLNNQKNRTSGSIMGGEPRTKITLIKYLMLLVIFLTYAIILILFTYHFLVKCSSEQPCNTLVDHLAKARERDQFRVRSIRCSSSPTINNPAAIKLGNMFDGGFPNNSTNVQLNIERWIRSISVTSSDRINSIECIYSSANSLNTELPKFSVHKHENYRNEIFNVAEKNSDERIDRINVMIDVGTDSFWHIVGIQFHTTSSRTSPFYGRQQGQFYTEAYPGFVLGHLRSEVQMNFTLFQFIWYKI